LDAQAGQKICSPLASHPSFSASDAILSDHASIEFGSIGSLGLKKPAHPFDAQLRKSKTYNSSMIADGAMRKPNVKWAA